VPLEDGAAVLEAQDDRSDDPWNVSRSIRHPCRSTNRGLCASAAGRCASFIHRSARQRRNSISAASSDEVLTTAVVPSYSSARRFTTRPRASKSRFIGVPGYGVGCWM
jgi:hypothetical protein